MEEGAIEARGSETRTYTRVPRYSRVHPASPASTRATPYLPDRASIMNKYTRRIDAQGVARPKR